MKKILSITLIASFLLNACVKEELVNIKNLSTGDSEAASKNSFSANAGYEMVPNEMLIKFKPDVNATGRANALSRLNAQISEHILTAVMKSSGDHSGIYLVRVPIDVMSSISKAKAFSEIEYAEPNYIYRHEATSNDPYVTNGNNWGLTTSFGSGASTLWAKTKTGSTGDKNVVVGIIDEGAMWNHSDLSGQFGNPNEIAANGTDDDGNGFVDDVTGWDFTKNDNTTFDGSADDHGTHVAGTIGAIGGNGLGVAGMNWNITMISAKFLGQNGGTTANAIKAVDYMTGLKSKGINIIATNNSWGGGGFSQSLKNSIDAAGAAGILFIAAAGNSGYNLESTPSYPASYSSSNIISVAALTSSGGLASYSNYGATSVDLGAPGSGIISTVPNRNLGSAYASYSGTSMATPHVTGACALYKAINPSATSTQIKNAILNSVKYTPSLDGKTAKNGRLDVSGF